MSREGQGMTDEDDPKRHTEATAALESSITAAFPGMDQELKQTIASMGASLAVVSTAEKKKQLPAPPAAQVPVKILQFPLPFGEDTRAAVNVLLRSALFAPIKERQHFTDYQVVGNIDGYFVEWKGEQLNQDDHDTFLQLVKMALHKPLGLDVVQSVNAVLKGLGRQTRQTQRKQFFREVDRLMSGTIRVTPKGGQSYGGHLVHDILTPQDQKTEPRFRRFFSYQLNPKFARFYNADAYTLINTKTRQQIKGRGSELAKWLHLIIESHVEMFPTKVETYHKTSKSTTRDTHKFRQLLRQALDLLKEQQIITGWSIDPDSDLVNIDRTPSRSQQKHIAKKQGRAAFIQAAQEYNPASRHRKPRV